VEERTADLRAEVEERRRAQESAARLSRVDWLTGLSNRRHFETLLRERLQADLPGVLGLLFVDLDHFKGVNDRYGHLAGDELLREAAVRLSLLVPPDALVARFGGDEFVVMLTMATVCEVDALAAQVVDAFATPLVVRQQAMQLTCSVGAAVHPDAAGGADNLMQRADTALLDAKHAGRSCWRRLDPAGWERATYSAHVMGELAGAGSWRVSLPAAVAAERRSLRCDRGAAALAAPDARRDLAVGVHPAGGGRRHDPTHRALGAGACLCGRRTDRVRRPPCAQRRLGHLRQRLGAAAATRELQPRPARCGRGIGLAARSVGAGGDRVDAALRERRGAASIAAVEAIGARFAIDDCGTGYASFGQLERLGASKLKLDRSLVQLLDEPAPRPSLPKAMIALGHSLGMVVTAEGVETQDQLQMLVTQGCDSVQGFAVGRPVSLALLAAELGRTEINGRSVSTR
jgi:diguanylate cyclase (GGDEF)-like protein